MKTKLLAAAVALVVLSAFAKIILYTDKPNAVPVNSDFFSLQRNSDYINASVAQVKGDWFNNPVFTGNGSINGSFTANNYFGDGSALTGISSSGSVSNIVIAFSKDNTNFSLLIGANGTNFTLLVGANDTNYVNQVSNLLFQLISSSTNSEHYILSNNGNGTNTTNWGVSSFQDVQAQNLEATNLFTGLTNKLLSTDGNGVITNVGIGSGISFSANVISATGASASDLLWSNAAGKAVLVSNTLDVVLGDVSQTPTHLLHIFHTNAANNDVVGIDSTSSDSSSMFHLKNRTAQGPFFDYESANVRWGFGISPLNNFVMRTGPNSTDPVNGSTVTTIATNGGWTVNALTNNAATPGTVSVWNSDKGLVSFANGTGFLHDDGSGGFSWLDISNSISIVNLYATTNFSTNLFFVSGKGNTLIVTNVAVYSTLTNFGVAASSIMSTDAKQVETNATIGSGLSFSANVLALSVQPTNEVTRQINSGTNIYSSLGSAISDLSKGTNYAMFDTNLISTSFTWIGPSNTVPVDQGYHFYTATGNVSFTNMLAVSGSNLWSTVVVSNQTGSAITAYSTIPGVRIYSGSSALSIPAAKTGVFTFLSISTLMTNEQNAAQSN